MDPHVVFQSTLFYLQSGKSIQSIIQLGCILDFGERFVVPYTWKTWSSATIMIRLTGEKSTKLSTRSMTFLVLSQLAFEGKQGVALKVALGFVVV